MEILENIDDWSAAFANGWLAELQSAGTFNWGIYPRPANKTPIAGPAIDVSQAKIMLVTSSGAYHPATQSRYDAEHDLGDYSVRAIPMDAAYDAIDYAHTHYDHTARKADPQVLMPLTHLANLVDAGELGSLTSRLVSFMGYQPDIARVARETAPAVVQLAQEEGADAVLLVPS